MLDTAILAICNAACANFLTTLINCTQPVHVAPGLCLLNMILTALARDLTKDRVASREATMWRYHELLPVRQERHVLTLGEGMTPLLSASHLAPQGLESKARLLVKDEGQNPTGSFKARGMAAARLPRC